MLQQLQSASVTNNVSRSLTYSLGDFTRHMSKYKMGKCVKLLLQALNSKLGCFPKCVSLFFLYEKFPCNETFGNTTTELAISIGGNLIPCTEQDMDANVNGTLVRISIQTVVKKYSCKVI